MLEEIYRHGISTKSDLARKHACAVGVLASHGLITVLNRTPVPTRSRFWQATSAGVTVLEGAR